MFGAGRAGDERVGRWRGSRWAGGGEAGGQAGGSRWAGARSARGQGPGWVVGVSRTVLCLQPTAQANGIEWKSSTSVLEIIVRDQILTRDREV